MLADTARLVNNRSKVIMFVWLIACIAAGCVIQPVAALVVAGITILMFSIIVSCRIAPLAGSPAIWLDISCRCASSGC